MDETNRDQGSTGELPVLHQLFTLYDGFELRVNHSFFRAWLIDYTTAPPDPVQHGQYRLTLVRAVDESDELMSVKLIGLDTAGHSPDTKERYRQEIEEERRSGQTIQHFYIRAVSDPISADFLLRNVIYIHVIVLSDEHMEVYTYYDQDVPAVADYVEQLTQGMKRRWEWRPIPEVEQRKAKAKQLQERLLSEMERKPSVSATQIIPKIVASGTHAPPDYFGLAPPLTEGQQETNAILYNQLCMNGIFEYLPKPMVATLCQCHFYCDTDIPLFAKWLYARTGGRPLSGAPLLFSRPGKWASAPSQSMAGGTIHLMSAVPHEQIDAVERGQSSAGHSAWPTWKEGGIDLGNESSLLLASAGLLFIEAEDASGWPQIMYLGVLIAFEVTIVSLSLQRARIEVTASCCCPEVMGDFDKLLDSIGKAWPEANLVSTGMPTNLPPPQAKMKEPPGSQVNEATHEEPSWMQNLATIRQNLQSHLRHVKDAAFQPTIYNLNKKEKKLIYKCWQEAKRECTWNRFALAVAEQIGIEDLQIRTVNGWGASQSQDSEA